MKTSFHGSFSLSCSLPHPSFASRRYFSVLIAPLFAIFVLHDALPGHTRERGRKSNREESDEKWGEEKSFRRSSSPLHSRALRRRFSDALHLFIGTRTGLLLSLFFRVPGTPVIHTAHCTSSATANALRTLSTRMQFLQWLFSKLI